MKKIWIIISIVIFSVIALVVAIVISFKVVKQTTDKINFALKDNFKTIVTVPKEIPPENKSFTKTAYIWDMETPAGEVTGVKFTHDTAFAKETNQIAASLEMAGTDPGLFAKVLPAIIVDKQSQDAALDSQHRNLNANAQAGYQKIEVFTPPNTDHVTKITWYFDKNYFVNKNEGLYQKIYKYPTTILSSLYKLQRSILTIFST